MIALDMKSACNTCGASLPADGEAYICSYECTFCRACCEGGSWVCPNCGGELVARPRRGVAVGVTIASDPRKED